MWRLEKEYTSQIPDILEKQVQENKKKKWKREGGEMVKETDKMQKEFDTQAAQWPHVRKTADEMTKEEKQALHSAKVSLL